MYSPKWSDLQYQQLSFVRVTFSCKRSIFPGAENLDEPFWKSHNKLQIHQQFETPFFCSSSLLLYLSVFSFAPFFLFLPESTKDSVITIMLMRSLHFFSRFSFLGVLSMKKPFHYFSFFLSSFWKRWSCVSEADHRK